MINAFLTLTKTEGIIPALESAHAVSHAIKIAKKRSKSDSIVLHCLDVEIKTLTS